MFRAISDPHRGNRFLCVNNRMRSFLGRVILGSVFTSGCKTPPGHRSSVVIVLLGTQRPRLLLICSKCISADTASQFITTTPAAITVVAKRNVIKPGRLGGYSSPPFKRLSRIIGRFPLLGFIHGWYGNDRWPLPNQRQFSNRKPGSAQIFRTQMLEAPAIRIE